MKEHKHCADAVLLYFLCISLIICILQMFPGSLFYFFFFMFLTILLSLQSIKKTIHPQSLEAVDKWLKTATDKGLFE